jgi:hypothetical protein
MNIPQEFINPCPGLDFSLLDGNPFDHGHFFRTRINHMVIKTLDQNIFVSLPLINLIKILAEKLYVHRHPRYRCATPE